MLNLWVQAYSTQQVLTQSAPPSHERSLHLSGYHRSVVSVARWLLVHGQVVIVPWRDTDPTTAGCTVAKASPASPLPLIAASMVPPQLPRLSLHLDSMALSLRSYPSTLSHLLFTHSVNTTTSAFDCPSSLSRSMSLHASVFSCRFSMLSPFTSHLRLSICVHRASMITLLSWSSMSLSSNLRWAPECSKCDQYVSCVCSVQLVKEDQWFTTVTDHCNNSNLSLTYIVHVQHIYRGVHMYKKWRLKCSSIFINSICYSIIVLYMLCLIIIFMGCHMCQ